VKRVKECRNIKLTLAYDGTGYSGFQRQLNTKMTIQEKLEEALGRLTKKEITLHGAGRTDAGVHALGQVVNFRTSASIPVERWPYALRGLLPPEIVVYKAEEVPKEFHARYTAVAKTYIYRIWSARWPSVFHQRYTLFYPGELQEDPIRETLEILKGTHDFRAFAAQGSAVRNTVRTISALVWEEKGDERVLTVRADGFLYHMVRNIVGTLLWVGEGRLTPEQVQAAMVAGQRKDLGPTAPPMGLCLKEVEYPPNHAKG